MSMELFDSHFHIDGQMGPHEVASLLDRALAAGVMNAVAVGGSPALNRAAVRWAARYPDRLAAAIGFDRDQAPAMVTDGAVRELAMADLLAGIKRLMREGAPPVAMGEIGLDFHYAATSAEAQRALFAAQLELARELELPVIVHSRNADADTLSALREHAGLWRGSPERLGVLHCFTGSQEFATRLIDLGLFISFSGIVTFRSADALRSVAAGIPDDRLLIETDSPFLAPEPMRGRVNEPANVRYVAHCLATVRRVAPQALAECTTRNAALLFGRLRQHR